MTVIEKFLGRRVQIPDDRHYVTKQGLWAKESADTVSFGLTEPALILSGGFKDLDWLVENGAAVEGGESVVFAITGKILYLDAPIKGTLHFNEAVKHRPELLLEDPYGEGWVFKITPFEDLKESFARLADAPAYVESLKNTEGFKNPDGLKGGVSGMCKAVYGGIGEQKI